MTNAWRQATPLSMPRFSARRCLSPSSGPSPLAAPKRQENDNFVNIGPTAAKPQRYRLAAARLRKRVIGDQPIAQRRIVVGVDGSESSKAALAWALRQAKLTGAVVEAVIAWKLPATFGLIPLSYMGSLGATRKILADSIAETGNQPRCDRG